MAKIDTMVAVRIRLLSGLRLYGKGMNVTCVSFWCSQQARIAYIPRPSSSSCSETHLTTTTGD